MAHPLPSDPHPPEASAWQGRAWIHCRHHLGRTHFQGGSEAPLKLLRASHHSDGRCELPLLHTAGGLVGGDRLAVEISLGERSSALITSVAAQKVYGSVGRSRRTPAGAWARQDLVVRLEPGADLEWLPQEMVLYADGLLEQHTRVELAPGASWLGAEVVRLGRTAAGEALGAGCWRSSLEILRRDPTEAGSAPARWEFVDRLSLGGGALTSPHGLGGEPVVGTLVWAAPAPLAPAALADLVARCRLERRGLVGEMACGALTQGLVARYRGPSSAAARWWFTRLWARIRESRGLAAPVPPRVWPFQENPLAPDRLACQSEGDSTPGSYRAPAGL
jgi:urease accessory protein